jgi:hypothetical protein
MYLDFAITIILSGVFDFKQNMYHLYCLKLGAAFLI